LAGCFFFAGFLMTCALRLELIPQEIANPRSAVRNRCFFIIPRR
jgi:hypothetical protein